MIIGDSVPENLFVHESERMGAVLEHSLLAHGLRVKVLNAGYSGATILHNLNVFLNKIVPIKPIAVLVISGVIDLDATMKRNSFWSVDRYIRPILPADGDEGGFDQDVIPEPNLADRYRLMTVLHQAGIAFNIPVWFSTNPHLQVYAGEYAEKNYDATAFELQRQRRCQVNASIRQFGSDRGATVFDLEGRMADNLDAYHDTFHLSARGVEQAVRHLTDQGLIDAITARVKVLT